MRTLLTAVACTAGLLFTVSANADSVKVPDRITATDGLGDGGYAYVYPGLHQSDGAVEFYLVIGTSPKLNGSVTFKLNSTDANFYQPCVFGNGYVWDAAAYPQVSYWPMNSQIGVAGANPATGEVKFYYHTTEPLVTGQVYLVTGVCPPMDKNPTH